MTLNHNSQTADSEPTWSDVDKTALPNNAFADMTGRRFPHHWVKGGGDKDDDGRYTTGTMYLHKGGLNAAWSAAQGARSGKEASAAIKSHLNRHRKALGLDKDAQEPVSTENRGNHTATHPQGPQKAALGRVLLQPSPPEDDHLYDAILVTAGRIKQDDGQDSKWLIPAHVLQEALDAGHFNAIPHYVDHPELFGFGWSQRPSVRDLAGIATIPQWDADQQAVTAQIRLYDTEAGQLLRSLYDQIIADKEAGEPVPPIGLSIACFREYEHDDETGTRRWTKINKVSSVDAVYEPGAAGYIQAALSAIGHQHHYYTTGYIDPTPRMQENPTNLGPRGAENAPREAPGSANRQTSLHTGGTMSDEEARTDAEQSPSPTPEETTQDPPPWDPHRVQQNLETLNAAVDRIHSLLAQQQESNTVEGMGEAPRGPALFGGWSGLDRVEMAVEAMLSGTRPPHGVRPLTGIRELYMLLSGDYEMTGRFHDDRVYLANVTTSTMAGLVANALNKIVINMFQSYDQWWAPGVTVRDFNSLQDIRWITLGGVGELPTVAEGAAYTELTWDDQTETDSFVKKGGYLGITIETIDKDDTGRVMAAPRALAQGAWLTLGKSIAEIFTSNSGTGPSMSDSNNLFDSSNHSNLGSTALSYAEWQVVKIAMMKQTEVNSSERLGGLTRPRLLWVPIDLEATALEILAAGEGEPDDADYHVNPDALADGLTARTAAARRRVITVPFWTDTNNWAAQADPQLYPSIGLGFRYGRTPEVFSVADPRAGLMFTNDTMPVKVRFFYAVGPTDWRGLYKENVS